MTEIELNFRFVCLVGWLVVWVVGRGAGDVWSWIARGGRGRRQLWKKTWCGEPVGWL